MFYSDQQNAILYIGSATADVQLEVVCSLGGIWMLVLGPQVHDAASIGRYTTAIPDLALLETNTKYLVMRNPYDRVFKAYEEYCNNYGATDWSTWFASADYTGSYLDPLTSQFPDYDQILHMETIESDFDSAGLWPELWGAWADQASVVVLPIAEIPPGDKPAIATRYAADFTAGGYTP